jgi:hypothetical protein
MAAAAGVSSPSASCTAGALPTRQTSSWRASTCESSYAALVRSSTLCRTMPKRRGPSGPPWRTPFRERIGGVSGGGALHPEVGAMAVVPADQRLWVVLCHRPDERGPETLFKAFLKSIWTKTLSTLASRAERSACPIACVWLCVCVCVCVCARARMAQSSLMRHCFWALTMFWKQAAFLELCWL